jgi:hypothetical protein
MDFTIAGFGREGERDAHGPGRLLIRQGLRGGGNGHSRAGDECREARRPIEPGRHSVGERWDRTGTDRAAILTIIWRELGGPPIAAPVTSGHGLNLICDLICHELGGTVDLTFQPMARAAKLKFPFSGGDAAFAP